MNYKLIMLPQPILVSEKLTIEEANFISHYQDVDGNFFKIIAGLPDLPKLDLSLIAKKIGWVDLNKIESDYFDEATKGWDEDGIEDYGHEVRQDAEIYLRGFKAGQSLNEKKYSEKDMSNLWQYIVEGAKDILISGTTTISSFEDYIQSLSKPKEYQVEVEMELISNEYDYDEDETTLAHSIESWEQPKITNNTIKILRTI